MYLGQTELVNTCARPAKANILDLGSKKILELKNSKNIELFLKKTKLLKTGKRRTEKASKISQRHSENNFVSMTTFKRSKRRNQSPESIGAFSEPE